MNSSEPFECAFVAVSYLLGRKDGAVSSLAHVGPTARALTRGLASAERAERARHLAAALRGVVGSLEARVLR